MPFNHKIFFDSVRNSLFHGTLSQDQVDGMDAILSGWEQHVDTEDFRWLAYMFATTYHETSQEMMPVEEYGKGSGQPYGSPDPETGQTYYGRGFVQLTWRENYAKADQEIHLSGSNSCEWYAVNALTPSTAARVMYFGMTEGWFRSDSQGRQTLERYFNSSVEDPYGAREIINGDKKVIPDWANGVSIGNLIRGYYENFLAALTDARIAPPAPPVPDEVPHVHIDVTVAMDAPVAISLTINGEEIRTTAAAVELTQRRVYKYPSQVNGEDDS